VQPPRELPHAAAHDTSSPRLARLP
jgi:hypothetical protein